MASLDVLRVYGKVIGYTGCGQGCRYFGVDWMVSWVKVAAKQPAGATAVFCQCKNISQMWDEALVVFKKNANDGSQEFEAVVRDVLKSRDAEPPTDA